MVDKYYFTAEYTDLSRVWNRRKFTTSTWLQRLGDSLRKFFSRD